MMITKEQLDMTTNVTSLENIHIKELHKQETTTYWSSSSYISSQIFDKKKKQQKKVNVNETMIQKTNVIK